MLHVAMGQAEGLTLLDAARAAVDAAAARLGHGRPVAGLLFTSFYEGDFAAALDLVRQAFGPLELAGCTSDGEASSDSGFSEKSCALLLFWSQGLEAAAGLATDFSADPEGSLARAVALARARLSGPETLCLVLPDGLSTIGIPLDRLLQKVLGPDLPVFGGTAGDGFLFRRTWQFCGAEAVTDGCAFLLLRGPLVLSHGARCGWKPLGRAFRLTEFQGNEVRRIEDQPALEFLARYLGPDTSEYSQFPLAVFPEDGDGRTFFLRDPVFINEADGSIRFVGNFPERARIRFAEAGRDDIVAAAREALERAVDGLPGRPELVLFFSCASRRRILGTRAPEELDVLAEKAPGVPWFGFYTYGEIGSLDHPAGACFFNDTFVALALGSADHER
jgi:hypothetical protein